MKSKLITIPHSEIKEAVKTRLKGTNGYPDFVLQFPTFDIALILSFMDDKQPKKMQDLLDCAHVFNGWNAWPIFEGCCYALEHYTPDELLEIKLLLDCYYKNQDFSYKENKKSFLERVLTLSI